MLMVLYLCIVFTRELVKRSRPLLSRLSASAADTVSFVLMLVIFIYVTLPLFLIVLRRWVYSPWKDSTNAIGRILQRGFPCIPS
jgi:nitrate/nitrite-specific signal transduction histidine kinase